MRRFLDRELVGRWADAFVAVSAEDRRKMIEVEGVDPARRYGSSRTGSPTPRTATARTSGRSSGSTPGAPVLGVVCELRAQKALEVLFEAAARLRGELPALKVLVAGDGPERARLEAEVEAARRSRTPCCLLGIRRDVPAAARRGRRRRAVSSDYEGSPLSVMEYMAAGEAVVSTRVGGVPELVEDGVHGLLVEPRDPEALAEAVGRLLRDPAVAKRLGAEGRERQRREYSLDAMVAPDRGASTRSSGSRAGGGGGR